MKRPGSSSSYTGLTGSGRQRLSQTVQEERGGREGLRESAGLTLNITTDGQRSAMSYLSVDDRRQKDSSLVIGGGYDGSSTGSDSVSHSSGQGNGGINGRQQVRSPLSPNVELERAKAKIRLLEKEVYVCTCKCLVSMWSVCVCTII